MLLIEGPGGGGYGAPETRPVDMVLADVKAGTVTRDGARRDYGVAIGEDLSVDEVETGRLRAALATRKQGGHFDYGANREAYERIWTAERYAALTEVLMTTPIPWRHYVKHRIFAMVTDAPGTGGAQQVYEAFDRIAAMHPDTLTGGRAQARAVA